MFGSYMHKDQREKLLGAKHVAIIGAGAAGMAAADTLARANMEGAKNAGHGFRVTVFERARIGGGQATSREIDSQQFGSDFLNDGVQGGPASSLHSLEAFRRIVLNKKLGDISGGGKPHVNALVGTRHLRRFWDKANGVAAAYAENLTLGPAPVQPRSRGVEGGASQNSMEEGIENEAIEPCQQVGLQMAFGRDEHFWTNAVESPFLRKMEGSIGRLHSFLKILRNPFLALFFLPLAFLPLKSGALLCCCCLSQDFVNRVLVPLVALSLGTGIRTSLVPSFILAFLFGLNNNDETPSDSDSARLKPGHGGFACYDLDRKTFVRSRPQFLVFCHLSQFYQKWVDTLRSQGVEFVFNSRVERIERGARPTRGLESYGYASLSRSGRRRVRTWRFADCFGLRTAFHFLTDRKILLYFTRHDPASPRDVLDTTPAEPGVARRRTEGDTASDAASDCCNELQSESGRKGGTGVEEVVGVGEGPRELMEEFDAVIFATRPDEALRILGPSAGFLERWLLSSVGFADVLTVTHTDRKYMRDHYELEINAEIDCDSEAGRGYDPTCMTYLSPENPAYLETSFNCTNFQIKPRLLATRRAMRRAGKEGLHELPPLNFPATIFQTSFFDKKMRDIWTIDRIDKSKILFTKRWQQMSHSWRFYATVVPCMWLIQGPSTLFAGGWLLMNTHEVALVSGIAAAYRLGAPYRPIAPQATKAFSALLLICHHKIKNLRGLSLDKIVLFIVGIILLLYFFA